MIYRTKRADFEMFKEEALKWQKILGLTEWQLNFEWELSEDYVAEIYWDLRAMAATITLSKKLTLVKEKDIPTAIRRAAFHELIYLVTARLRDMAKHRTYEEDEWTSQHHALIRRLEYALFPKY